MDTPEALNAARVLWDYMKMNQPLEKADVIIVPGSLNTTPAEQAAKLFLEGWAPRIVMSGGLGRVTKHHQTLSEAQTFANIAIAAGVPPSCILIEDKSTNLGENIEFSREVLIDHDIHPKIVILVQKPYTERRVFAAFSKRWPEPRFITSSPQTSFEDWAAEDKKGGRFISFLVGDMQRIIVYPQKGWQIPQEVPDEVMEAYEKLIGLGYTEHLFRG